MEEFLNALQVIVLAIVAIWGVYQTKVTKSLEQQVHRLNVGLDQSIQLLYRAREAVINAHAADIFMLAYRENQPEKPNELYMTKSAEWSAYEAELSGLAVAIGDKELLDLVNKIYSFTGKPWQGRDHEMDEIEIRGRSQHLHRRIAQLLKMATE